MSEIRDKIKSFSDEYLIEQFTSNQKDYTEDALSIMKEEITIRNLQYNSKKDDVEESSEHYSEEEFVPVDKGFSHIDVVIVAEMLKEEKIPFSVISSSGGVIPVESETAPQFIVSVPPKFLENTKEIINRHFDTSGEKYMMKFSSIRDRLKAFNFHDITTANCKMEEYIEVTFTQTEITSLKKYISRLIDEADAIESKNERILFYYDNLEECYTHLEQKSTVELSRCDLLTIIEVLQIYCDEQDFPGELDALIETILNFFLPDRQS